MHVDKMKTISSNKRNEEIIQYINTLDIDNLNKNILKEVTMIAINRVEFIFPKGKVEQYILFTIILFMAKPIKENVKNEKKRIIEELIRYTIDAEKENKFDSGKLSFMILNIIYFFFNILLYFILSISIIQLNEKLSKNELEKLLIDKVEVGKLKPDEVKNYLSDKLKSLNPKLKNADPVVDTCLPYVFDPIKDRNLINNLQFSCI
jgi:hypothetical protein